MAGYAGSFNQLSVPLARGGQNFAPLRPIQDAIKNKKTNKEPTKFEQAVRELYTHYLNYERIAWNEIISMAQLVALFRKGQQLLVRRPYGPGYYVRPIANDDTYRQTAMNFMNFYSNICESKIVASNPSVNMRAGDDTPEAIATAKACRPVVDYYEGEWYDDKFTRREAIRYLTDGMVIHQVRWNPFRGGMSMASRQVSQQEVELDEGYGECADCSFGGVAEAFAEGGCPKCGSQAIDVAPPQKQSLAQISMGPRKPVGEPEIISSPLAAWRWDLNKDLECSPWAIKRQRITQGAIKLLLGDINIADASTGEQYGLDVIHALAYAGQAFQGQSATQWRGNAPSYEKTPTMCEFWISPEDLACLEIEESQTIAGATLPEGRLSDVFKDPICIVGLNDMQLIVGVYTGESHQDEVVTAQWFMDGDSGIGRGLEDTAGVQKRANAVDGQIYQGLATTATPSVITDMSILKEDQSQYLFRPGQNIDVSLAMLPPGTSLKDAFFIGNPGVVSQQYIQYGQTYLKEMAQISSMAVEYGETLLSIDNRTATGAQITAQLANSLFGPMLLGKGMSRVKIAKKIICLTVSHDVGGRFYPGKEGTQGRFVKKEELQGKVIFELVQNSQLPVTPFSQQTDVRVLMESFQGAAGLVALKQGDAQMFRQLTKPFNVSFDTESEDDVSTLCLERLNQMMELLKMGVDDPAMLVQGIQPPVSQYEPKHKEKREWWSYWLDLPTAQKSPMEIRLAAEQMWNLHENMATQLALPQAVNQGMVQGAGMAAAQAPSALGAQAMGLGQEQQAPAEDPTQQIEADMQIEQMNAEKELNLKQMEGETQRDVAQIQAQGQLRNTALQGRNQLENTRLAGENAVKVAKAKPKPKPAAKKTA